MEHDDIDAGTREVSPFSSDEELYRFFSKALRYVWEKWITTMNLVLTFAGATILVYLNSMGVSNSMEGLVNKGHARWSLFAALGSVVCSVAWRFAAQNFLERDVLGSRSLLLSYFSRFAIARGTRYGPIYGGPRLFAWLRVLYYLAMVLAIALLGLSWFLGVQFLAANLQ